MIVRALDALSAGEVDQQLKEAEQRIAAARSSVDDLWFTAVDGTRPAAERVFAPENGIEEAARAAFTTPSTLRSSSCLRASSWELRSTASITTIGHRSRPNETGRGTARSWRRVGSYCASQLAR